MTANAVLWTTSSGRTDWPLLTAGSVAAVATALIFGAAEDTVVRATTAGIGVALIIVSFTLLRRLELALYSFIPLMTTVRVEPAPVDFMAVGLMGALLIRGDIRRIPPPRLALVALPLLLLSYAIAILNSPSDQSMIYAAKTLLMVVVGCVAYELASKDRRTAERAVLGGGILIAVQALLAISPAGDVIGMREEGLRVRGLFKDANEFGVFAVPAVLLLCVRWPALPLRVRIAGIAVLLVPIVTSLSRAPALALGVALVVLAAVAAYRHLPRILVRTTGLLGIGVLGVAILLAMPRNVLPEHDTRSLIQPYDSERFAGQTAGLNQVLENPISLGIGLGNYANRLGHASHQTYLQMLVETGPLSLVALLLLLWAGIRTVGAPDLRMLVWASALAGFAACGLFIDTLHWRELWLVLGLTLAFANPDRGEIRLRTLVGLPVQATGTPSS